MADSGEKSHILRILIVEDESITATLAEAMCRELGFAPSLAGNGEDALQAFALCKPDLILMDLQLPILGGFETAYDIRQIESEQGLEPTPIVAVTGNATKDNFERALKCGMNDCIEKPYTLQMLRRIVGHYFLENGAPNHSAYRLRGGLSHSDTV